MVRGVVAVMLAAAVVSAQEPDFLDSRSGRVLQTGLISEDTDLRADTYGKFRQFTVATTETPKP